MACCIECSSAASQASKHVAFTHGPLDYVTDDVTAVTCAPQWRPARRHQAGQGRRMAGAPSEGARFEVSLVPHDAREGESLHAALDALVRLSDVANSTFSRITDR